MMKHLKKLLFITFGTLVVAQSAMGSQETSSNGKRQAVRTGLNPEMQQTSPFLELNQDLRYEVLKNYLTCIELAKMKSTCQGLAQTAKDLEMPKGDNWVRWVKGLIEAGHSRKSIIKEVVLACTRCPNPLAELKAIAMHYYKNVPDNKRFWNWDMANNEAVYIAENQKLREDLKALCNRKSELQISIKESDKLLHAPSIKELAEIDAKRKVLLGQLLPCVEERQPYALAMYINFYLTGNNQVRGPLLLHHIYLDSVDKEAEYIEPWLREEQNHPVIQANGLCVGTAVQDVSPTIRNILAVQKGRKECEDDAKIIDRNFSRVISNPAESIKELPLNDDTFFFEDQHIMLQKRQIQFLQQALKRTSTFLLGRTIEDDVLKNALRYSQNGCAEFVRQRFKVYSAAIEAVEKGKPQEKIRLLLRQAELAEKIVEVVEGAGKLYFSRRAAEKNICVLRKSRNSLPLLQKAVALVDQVIALAGKAVRLLDFVDACEVHNDLGGFYYSREQDLESKNHYTQVETYCQQAIQTFGSQFGLIDWQYAARNQRFLAAVDASPDDVEHHLKTALGYLEKAISVTDSMQTAEGVAKTLKAHMETKRQYEKVIPYSKELARRVPHKHKEASELIANAITRIAEIDQKIAALEQAATEQPQIPNNNANNINSLQ